MMQGQDSTRLHPPAIVDLEDHASILQLLTLEDLSGRVSASYACARYLFAI